MAEVFCQGVVSFVFRWDNLLFHIHTFLCRKGTKNTGYTGQNANIL